LIEEAEDLAAEAAVIGDIETRTIAEGVIEDALDTAVLDADVIDA
jgi:hypothetical protein